MTYLEAVNKVLIRLREDTVSSVNQTSYSQLVGEFINDALRLVEDAWDWSALRTTLTVTTSENIFNYILTNSGNRGKILDVINDTSNFFIKYKDQHWFNNVFLNTDPAKGSPQYYTFNGVDSNGDTQVDIYPIPNGTYTLRFNMILRSPELTSDSDQIIVPSLPVIHLAVALATRERGEMGGNSTPEMFASADRMLSDAIALDAIKHPEETIFAPV
jgi:hypothetical protein